MGNTQSDIVIQKAEASQFMRSVTKINPSGKIREEFWVPYSKLVLHDSITTPSNPVLPEILSSLQSFLSTLVLSNPHTPSQFNP